MTSEAIQNKAVTSEKIAPQAVEGAHLGLESILGKHIVQEAIHGYHLKKKSIMLSHLADESRSAEALFADGSIPGVKSGHNRLRKPISRLRRSREPRAGERREW